MKNKLEIKNEIKQEQQLSAHEVEGIPKQLVRTRYPLTQSANIRDFGIASLNFFSYKREVNKTGIHDEILALQKNLKQLNEKRVSVFLENIEAKYKAGINFFYPIMDPVKTNTDRVLKTLLSIEKAKQKFERFKSGMLAKSKKNNNLQKTDVIQTNISKQQTKLVSETAIYNTEIKNRKIMLGILRQLKMPNCLQSFMEEINQLSIKDKESLLGLLSTKTRLSPKNDHEKNAYELMFAYEEGKDDLVVGIRSHYDLDHPHPTLIGGIDPTVMVAGTIDLCLNGNTLKIATVRIDSGHYRPEVETLGLIASYFKYSMNPEYFDRLELHDFDDKEVAAFPKGSFTNHTESMRCC